MINPFDSQLSEREQMLACVAFLAEGQAATELFDFAGEEVAAKLKTFAKRWFQKGRLNTEAVTQHVKFLKNRQEDLSFLHQIHPGWLVEHLKDESPRVIGLICRFLPSEKVRYLIQNLPKGMSDQLPRISDAYAVPTDLVTELRKMLEIRFRPAVLPRQGEPFSFYHLAWLKEEELVQVLKECGIMELAAAFEEVSRERLKALLHRFPYEQAKILYKRIRSPQRQWRSKEQAQRHVVACELEAIVSDDLFFEIGLSLLSHALTVADLEWSEAVTYHLPPKIGYRFKRSIQQLASVAQPEAARELKDLILDRMIQLAEAGVIRKYWKDEELTTDLPGEAA